MVTVIIAETTKRVKSKIISMRKTMVEINGQQ